MYNKRLDFLFVFIVYIILSLNFQKNSIQPWWPSRSISDCKLKQQRVIDPWFESRLRRNYTHYNMLFKFIYMVPIPKSLQAKRPGSSQRNRGEALLITIHKLLSLLATADQIDPFHAIKKCSRVFQKGATICLLFVFKHVYFVPKNVKSY